jgi:hypothetical protein
MKSENVNPPRNVEDLKSITFKTNDRHSEIIKKLKRNKVNFIKPLKYHGKGIFQMYYWEDLVTWHYKTFY